MSDRPGAPSPEHEPPEIAEVRRLLADARHLDPIPDDVAERMSRVLDDLGDEAPAARPESPTPNVIAIAPHRRRRAAALLVAAAAIVVGGVALQNVRLSSEGDTHAPEAQADSQGNAFGTRAPEDRSSAPSTPTSSERAGPATPVTIHPRRFAFDARQAQKGLGKARYGVDEFDSAQATRCTNVPPHARVLPATYNRVHAALVFQRPRGDSQVVELFLCGSTKPIRSITLSLP